MSCALKSAKSSIALQIYGLSDPTILNLLKQKKGAGIPLTIFHDKKGSKDLPSCLEAYPVKTSGLMHRKILIIDESLCLLGTANFTTQSLKMHDNLVVGLWSPAIAKFLRECIDLEGNFEVDGVKITAFLLPDFDRKAINRLNSCIDTAVKSIQVAMFTLTHSELVQKLANAQKRGVKVSVAIDRYTGEGASRKSIEILKAAGVEVLLNQGSQLLHHKWAIIDEKNLVMGSANWTKAAFANNQDCLLILEKLPLSQQKILRKLWNAIAIGSQKL